jgi:acetylglutamate kinase
MPTADRRRRKSDAHPPSLVIKIGGRAQNDPRLDDVIVELVARGVRLCVIHGGGDELSALQRRLGVTPQFRGGRRVTTADDLELVRMTLSGSANKRLVARLVARGVLAVGVSGEDGRTLAARALDPESLGAVGAPSSVDTMLIDHLQRGGFVPVVSPVARDEMASDGSPLNVNGDDAAAAIAAALGADELLFIADVPGVLVDGAVVPVLDPETADRLAAGGAATGGMLAKLEAARAALAGGVSRVRIGDVNAIGDPASGTSITLTPSAVH